MLIEMVCCFTKINFVLGDDSFIKAQVLAFVHSDPVASHSGFERTMQRAKGIFFGRE